MQQINVLTYNIHKGFSPGKIRFLLPKMREAIESVNPDIVFLQEVSGEAKRQEKIRRQWPDATQFEFLADQLWPHYAYGKNAIYQSGHHGNAILSKYPIMFWENISLTHVARASRSVLHGVVALPDGSKLHVMCIHLGLFKSERNEQLEVLKDRIAQTVPADEALILAGDFNDWRKEAVEYLEAELGVREVFVSLSGDYAKTFPAWSPALQNDRIYFRGLNLLHGFCLNKKPWRTLSDHLPLTASFEIGCK